MKSNEAICIDFLFKRESNNANMRSIGNKLFSYNTCIAQHSEESEGKQIIIINKTKYSQTTTKHLYILRNTINKEKFNIKEVDNQPINTTHLNF